MVFVRFGDFFRRGAIVLSIFLLSYVIFSDTSEVSSPQPLQEKAQKTYVLREYEGALGVFYDGETEPIRVYEVIVASLPDGDRELLDAGIIANNEEELHQLLEDYTS